MVKSLSAKFRPNYCAEITVHDEGVVYVFMLNYKSQEVKEVNDSVEESSPDDESLISSDEPGQEALDDKEDN